MGTNTGKDKNFFLLQDAQTGSGSLPKSYTMDTGVTCRAQRSRYAKMNVHLHPALRLRTNGAGPLLLTYAPMAGQVILFDLQA